MIRDDASLFEAVACALGREADAASALERTLEIVCRALGLDTGWVWLLDPETDAFYLAASFDLPPYLREPVQMTGESCWCIESFRDGDFVSENVDVIECSRLRKAVRHGTPELTAGHLYHASVALRFGERQLGLMNVSGPDRRALHGDELRLLSAVGAQVGLAVERARLAETAATLARTEERTRLAREIHDTLAQDLTAVALQLESALGGLDRDPPSARMRVETALAVARGALAHARDSVLTLRADPLAGKPLAAALGALVRRFSSQSGIVATFADASARGVPHALEVELYRIASEALANVRAHAHARRVVVRLTVDETAADLAVEDDGVGYDGDAPGAADGGHYGVVGMAERAASVGGTFAIGRGFGGTGTRVAVRTPLR